MPLPTSDKQLVQLGHFDTQENPPSQGQDKAKGDAGDRKDDR